ncbi:uncharacterized protein H6S33_000713 [Morchella sextelata]|uniref:uncharacterized protein n=1 Tax=Morchella sextelata TaxID=1174677 RepID=UPI001D03C97D|nr:uncharacterized protein H6S33_000713 [Morchella sextelata]KAH0615077.1 hypothetical protein H6S33_000713 [Morchella sextelata]
MGINVFYLLAIRCLVQYLRCKSIIQLTDKSRVQALIYPSGDVSKSKNPRFNVSFRHECQLRYARRTIYYVVYISWA